MKKLLFLLCIFGLLTITVTCAKHSTKTNDENLFIKFVDPFIGTGGHGHTYPGATVPFGMVQLSPDNGISNWDWCSGYHYNDSIAIGFSHLHLSGTGIGDLYDIRLMPINKKVDLSLPMTSRNEVPYRSVYSHKKETATPGYYQLQLKDHNITVELTTAQRSGYHKYTYVNGDTQAVVIDLGFTINWDKTLDSEIHITDEHTVTGYRYSTGWAKNQKVFYAIKFSKPIQRYELVTEGNYVEKQSKVKGLQTYAQLYFDQDTSPTVFVQVAISSVSVTNALENLSNENHDFKTLLGSAKTNWNDKLSQIEIETRNENLKTIFYTALYHTQIAPVTFSDANGAFRLENDSIVTASNFTAYSTLSLWDTFRAEHPLLTLLEPDKVADIINSMLAYYEVNNVLPVWTLYGNETNTMTGFHSIPVIAEAYLKGIRGFSIEKAYEAMQCTMMGNNRGLNHYKKFGYIPYNLLNESVTITLEYAYNDWCVAQIAKALGKDEDYVYFKNRSKAYVHLFDKNTGFMRGKNEAGTAWKEPFDPKYSAHRIGAEYTEGNAWQHSWFVLHEPENLIAMHGGKEAFCKKLEQLFTESSEITGENVSADISGLIGQYAHGNEPSHHIAYLFNFAGQPWKTQQWVREILHTQYSANPDGLSGNEDCGQMSAWYVFSAMGLYPFNPVSGRYQIGSPLFEKSTIQIAENTYFTIIAEDVSNENIYIQSAILNGKALNRTYITHREILDGGTLHFTMGNTPNKTWGITN